MRSLLLAIFILSNLMIVGCAAKTDVAYTQPKPQNEKNTRVYNGNIERVWDATISAVGESFFVIDNIERDSKIITLSFSVQDPNEYIDCGTLTVTNSGGMSGKGATSIQGAQATATYLVSDGSPHPKPALRTTALSGKANIILSKEGANSTKVKVMSRYVLLVNFESSRWVEVGFGGYSQPIQSSQTVSFSTGETGVGTKGQLQCTSRNTLEEAILDRIGNKLMR